MIGQKLMTFVEVAQAGSFTAASRTGTGSVAAISRTISRLEGELNVRLFNRSTRHLQLTEEGRILLDAAILAKQQLDDACGSIAERQGATAGLIRVALPAAFGCHHVMPSLSRLLARHPRLNVEIAFDDAPPDPLRSGFDVVVRTGAPHESRIVAQSLCKLPVVLLASPEYLARMGTPRRPEDLAGHQFINSRTPEGTIFSWRLKPRGAHAGAEVHFHPPAARVSVCSGYEWVLSGAVAGLGITAADIFSALGHLQAGKLKIVLPTHMISPEDDHIRLYAIYPHRTRLAPRVRAFIDFVVECARNISLDEFDPHAYGA